MLNRFTAFRNFLNRNYQKALHKLYYSLFLNIKIRNKKYIGDRV